MVVNHLVKAKDDKLRRMAAFASVVVASALILAKLIAYILTDSVAMLSSMVDSSVDLVASLVTMFGVARALRPADSDHRFGHGKAEPLAALAQAAFITGSSVLLCIEAVGRIYTPRQLQNIETGYAVVAFSIVLTVILLLFQRYVIRRTKSIAISADRLHYSGDVLINLAVAVTYAASGYSGLYWIDPLFALVISGILLTGAFRISRRALNVLMDRELDESDRAKIKSVALMQKGVAGVHDLRTRTDGERVFVEIHLEVDPEMTVRVAHDIAEAVTEQIGKMFPKADIIIHQDPIGIQEKRLDEEINSVMSARHKKNGEKE